MIREMNQEALAFVVHVGDFKASWTNCSDELYASRKDLFATIRHPFAFLPGDNEWTDCYGFAAGRYDPRERLAKLRELFYPNNAPAFGRAPFPIENQAGDASVRTGAPENMIWRIDGILFASFNISGSNDNFSRNAEMDREYEERSRANLSWLRRAFTQAGLMKAKGVVLLFHANPVFQRTQPGVRGQKNDAYVGLRSKLAGLAGEWKQPVLVIHGDTHNYRFDRPLRDPRTGVLVNNLQRLEVYGSPALGWVKITIDPATGGGSELFQVRPMPLSPSTE